MSKPIPEGWKLRSLDEIADRVITPVQGNPEHVLTISSTAGWVDQRQKWSRDMAGKSLSKYTQLKKGELSYNRGNSKTFPYGCVFKLRDWDVAAVPNVYHSFRAKADKADADFVQYSFHAGQLDAQLRSIITSSARANGLLNITARDFFSIKLPCPPLREQQKIAAILSSVDDVIEKTRAQIDKLKDLKTGMMQELLTKGIGHTEFKDSPVGRIPVAWKCVKMNEICTVNDGAHHTPTYVDSGVPFLRVTDLKNKDIFSGAIKYVSVEEHHQLIKRCKPEKGDILYSKNGTIGIPRLIDWNEEFSIFVSLALIKIKSASVLSEYLVRLMDSPMIHAQIKARSKQGTVTNLHLEEIRDFDIPLPDKDEQRKIAEILGSVSTAIEVAQEELELKQDLKKSLMQDLLTGKVRVKLDNNEPTAASIQAEEAIEEQQYDHAEQ